MKNRCTPDLMRTQALILAGGRGNHLFPLTINRPKPAIPFGGIFRIIDFTLANCLRSQLPNVALLTQYEHQQLCSYVRYAWGGVWMNSPYISQPLDCLPPSKDNAYRGTADAVFKNLPLLQAARPDYVLLLSGDHVYSMDYREILARHIELQADVTIATVERPLRAGTRFGSVEVDQSFAVARVVQQPLDLASVPATAGRSRISMGVYVFNTDVLIRSLTDNCQSRSGYDLEHDVIPSLIGTARVYAYDFCDGSQGSLRYWRDIGTLDSYYDASMDLVRRDCNRSSNIGCLRGSGINHYSHISQTVVSSGVRIEKWADVRDCILMPGVWIGPGASVRRAIVDEGVHIPAGLRIGWNADEDRKHYVVSPSGVVVVGESPQLRTPVTDLEDSGPPGSMRACA